MGTLIQYCTEASKFDGAFAWQAAGMGYVIVTENRHLIVIDGGNKEDAEGFLCLLERIAGGKPHIDLWIITHPHVDHFAALWTISGSSEYSDRLTVDRLCYCIPSEFNFTRRGEPCSCQRDIDRIATIAPSLGCLECRPAAGDRLDIDGTMIDFLYTYENAVTLADPNELSLIFTVTGKHRKAMFVGDSYPAGLEVAYRTYKDTPKILKSDILQVAHHGLNGGHTMFYKLVDADVALVPISRSGDRAMNLPEENIAHHNLYAERRAASVIKAFCGTSALEL